MTRRNESRSPYLLVCLLAISIATAATAQPGIDGLAPTGKFLLEIDGELDRAARVYQATNPPAILIVANSSKLPNPVLLDISKSAVRTVNLMQMAERPGGTIDLLPGAVLAAHGAFEIGGVSTGLEVGFSVDGVDALLRSKPPLLGNQEADDLIEHSPEYGVKAAAYQPSSAVIERLQGVDKPVTVKVFFGSWCSACAQLVPLILRVDEGLDDSRIDFDYYGLPQGKAFSEDSQASRWNITAVPTGVILVDGKEVGRLKGNDWRVPEQTLARVLGVS